MAFSKCFCPSTVHSGQYFEGFTSSIRDVLRTKDFQSRESVEKTPEEAKMQIEKENEVKTLEDKVEEEEGVTALWDPDLCDGLHACVHHRQSQLLCAPICTVYRFQSEDKRWLTVREVMSETPLTFSLPRQLLSVLVCEHATRIQEMKELGELPPQWECLRCDVIKHCNHLIGSYQETLVELDRLSASCCLKSSNSKCDKYLQFVPTNLHSQRMEVITSDNISECYEVITFGAPADHHQSFRRGGLSRLVAKTADRAESSMDYSPQELSRVTELLSSLMMLQPLLFGLAEELLSVSLELNTDRLLEVMDSFKQQTELFVHTLNDELVKRALLEIHKTPAPDHSHVSHDITTSSQDSMWANVVRSLHCITIMSNRLVAREDPVQQMTSANGGPNSGRASSSWQELLLPLVVTFRDCVREALGEVRTAVMFVLLQRSLPSNAPHGFPELLQRRHAVFSQALSAAVCGITLKLHRALNQPGFLQQLQTVGLLVQFQGLLSNYGEEAAILEDMEVGVADLRDVTFTLIEAKTEEPEDLLPTLSGMWGSLVVQVPVLSDTFVLLPWELKAGSMIQIHPVFFNIGIGLWNQCQSVTDRNGNTSLQERINLQSCQHLRSYCNSLRDELPNIGGSRSLLDLLDSLECSVESQSRKSGDILRLSAMVCHAVNGVRLTSCKSAEDRTAMSLTLEQCTLLQEFHMLGQHHFNIALDCMRRSRLSWGQMLGCYTRFWLPVCMEGAGDDPTALRRSSCHLYPVAILLVTSHLLVLWLILSLVLLLAQYQ
ncbi:hypothetical protein fugu_002098 [Takifugu bimaculatus]|uniref:Type II inositol 3,4-bisphosphate 4-phosphatase n=1 Tax=Takifugu bimaculatus TaxID=433685 RepID=A0A4Z2BPR8_9TELE|nr:hypothetical protein fugu_002098 [Takifugu bimaculatus]